MNLIKFNDDNVNNVINILKHVDDSIIMQLVQLALHTNINTERDNLRDEIYKSKYEASNLVDKELELERFIQQISSSDVRFKDQNKEYKWVKINTSNMGEISYRFYIAPNPEHMHAIVKKLIEVFTDQKVPVKFKYQLTSNMEHCDRIIIYSDAANKKLIEQSIKAVYQSSPQLFNGCERSVAWLYNTEVPGVYLAPETSGEAYSNVLIDAILEAKATFNFIYGLTKENSHIKLSEKDAEKAVQWMKMFICSIMFRKGILLSKDDRCVFIKDKNIKARFNYETGILEHSNRDSRGYFSVKFFPTSEGIEALLQNFYSVSVIKPQKGLETKYLTNEQRKEELDRIYYPYKFFNDSNQTSKKI